MILRCSLGSTHRLQMGTINRHNVLVSGEVDAVDDAGLVVEIKSSSSSSPDLSVQNMLCGVGKRACVEVKEQPGTTVLRFGRFRPM